MKRLAPIFLLLAVGLVTACKPSRPDASPDAAPSSPSPPPAQTLTNTVSLTLSQPLPPTVTHEEPVIPAPAPTPAPVPTTPSTLIVPPPTPAPLPPAPLVGPMPMGPPSSLENPPPVATTSTPIAVPVPSAPRTGIRLLAPEGQISDGLRQELAIKWRTEVIVDTYTTNDDAARKLSAPAPVYDLALVSYRLVGHLISEQKLSPLPPLPRNLQPAPKYLHHFFDRENAYSLPYAFSLAGIAVRVEKVKVTVNQWSDIFRETLYKETRLPDDAGFESSLVAKAGLRNASLPSKSPEAATTPDGISPIQVDAISNLKKKFATQPGWRFVLPGEGSVIYLHCVVSPANAALPKEKTAALLTAFFAPEITARLAEENYLGVTQPGAVKILAPASTADSMIYPPERILDKCVFIRSGFRPIATPAAAAGR